MATVNKMDDSPKPTGSVILIAVLEACGLAAAKILFGLDLWVVILAALCFVAAAMRTGSIAASLIVGNLSLGFAFATFLYGFPSWVSALLGISAIVVAGTYFTSRDGADPGSNDANPILYIALIVAIRAWTALYYGTNTAITETPNDYLDWAALFVLGVLPDLPVLANVILFVVLNGTLIVYLTLLVKRIVNPVAN